MCDCVHNNEAKNSSAHVVDNGDEPMKKMIDMETDSTRNHMDRIMVYPIKSSNS